MTASSRGITTLVAGVLLFLGAGRLAAQAEGAVEGRVKDTRDKRALVGAQVLLDGVVGAVTDTSGAYRIRGVRPGWRRVAARLIGYRGVVLDSVPARAGTTITADFFLEANPLELEPLVVTAPVDELLDPLATASEQKNQHGRSADSPGKLPRRGARTLRWNGRHELSRRASR